MSDAWKETTLALFEGTIPASAWGKTKKTFRIIGVPRKPEPCTSNTRQRVLLDTKLKLNSVALVREQTIPTERPPLVGEVSANVCGYRVSRGQRNGFPRSLISVL
jgi:hypothetical protein